MSRPLRSYVATAFFVRREPALIDHRQCHTSCLTHESTNHHEMASPIASLLLLLRENNRHLAEHLKEGTAQEIHSVGVVGAGTMGAAIAAAVLHADKNVILCDRDTQVLTECEHQVTQILTGEDVVSARLRKQLPPTTSPLDNLAITNRLQLSADLACQSECELVIEAISESVDAKHALYNELLPHLGPHATLVTNTSAIPICDLAQAAPNPAQFCGIHFLAPVRPGSLVEIIPGTNTSKSTLATAIAFSQILDQTAVVVPDRTGFVVNCILSPYLDEGVALLTDGATVEQVDRVAEQFGIVVGPLRILDEVGLDTALDVGRVLWQAYADRVTPSPVTIGLFKQGRLGRKSQAGFYKYTSTTPWADDATPDPEISEIITPWIREPRQVTDQEITDRLTLALLGEAIYLLEQNATDAQTIELISLVGLGFPAEHGGLLRWADSIGLAEILRRMEAYDWASRPTGIPELLIKNARSGHPLITTPDQPLA